MIILYLFWDIILWRITIFPSYLMIYNFYKNSLGDVLITGLVLDYLLNSWGFNIIILLGMYLINKKIAKKNKLLKNNYLINLANFSLYFSFGCLIYSTSLINYLLGLCLGIGFNSIWWIMGYYLKKGCI